MDFSTALPRGCLRSRVRLRLFEFSMAKDKVVSAPLPWRSRSPPGGSTLTTSAPAIAMRKDA